MGHWIQKCFFRHAVFVTTAGEMPGVQSRVLGYKQVFLGYRKTSCLDRIRAISKFHP